MEKTEKKTNPDLMIVCRAGFEPDLEAELVWRGGSLDQHPAPFPDHFSIQSGSGWMVFDGLSPGLQAATTRPFIFERQRLPHPQFVASGGGQAATITEFVEKSLETTTHPWALHGFTPDPQGEPGLTAGAETLSRKILEALRKSAPALADQFSPADLPLPGQSRVVQICLLREGAWVSTAPLSALTNPAPGGVYRIPGDSLAPSRSYLKLEEAFLVMGRQPALRERVIDLGAAPGGWSYGCLKRGCHVLAVDNGPMKIKGLEDLPGLLEHRKANGLSFRPAAGWVPTDWLISDMLVPPGETLGLLRRWLEGGWMRRFVVNIKLPQRHPLEALKPVETFLAGWPGLRYRMVQLYHDRREVTVTGELTTLPPAREATKKPREAGMKTHPRGAKSKKPTRRPPKQPGKKPVQPAARRRKRR